MSQPGKKKKPRMKMDLRVLCIASNNDNEQDDIASGEFGRSAGRCKYYKDKMKLVVHGKLLLNETLKELGRDRSGKTRICMLQCMGLETELYSLRLFANGLYVLESHGTLRIPTNFQDYAEGMEAMMNKLSLFKQLSLNMKDYCELVRASKYQRKTTLSRFTGLDKDAPAGIKWTRAVWNPPLLRKEYDDDDNEDDDE